MARVKRGPRGAARRKKITKAAKGFSAGRKNILRQAKQATAKAGQRAYDHRKLKKRQFRRLWQIKISAAAKINEMSYSTFMGGIIKKNIEIDRKILASLAQHYPEVFAKIAAEVKGVVDKSAKK